LTFCMWSHTFMQNICRRVVLRQRLIYYKGRSTFSSCARSCSSQTTA
jgi:hypothetical protein